MPLWAVLLIAIPLCVLLFIGLMTTMAELNPDPGWRRREAEIRRLEQEERLRRLRG